MDCVRDYITIELLRSTTIWRNGGFKTPIVTSQEVIMFFIFRFGKISDKRFIILKKKKTSPKNAKKELLATRHSKSATVQHTNVCEICVTNKFIKSC